MAAAFCLGATTAGATAPLKVGLAQWPGYDVIWYGAAERLFEERGVAVRFVRMDHQKDATRALLRGRMDGVFTSVWDLFVSGAAADQVKVVLVTNVSSGSDGVVVRNGLANMAELRGKTVAARLGSINQLILAEAMEAHGLGAGDVRIRDVSNDIAYQDFLDGEVDAAVLWQPLLGRAARRSGGEVVFTTADVDSLVIDTLTITKRSSLDRQGDWRRFMLAWLDIMHALETRPEQVFRSVAQSLGQDASDFAADYAGLVKGDAGLNVAQFGAAGAIHQLYDRMEAMAALFPTYPIEINRNIDFDGGLILQAIEEWAPAEPR